MEARINGRGSLLHLFFHLFGKLRAFMNEVREVIYRPVRFRS